MNEAFLHFIWKFQNFNNKRLSTHTGEQVQIMYAGSHNHHAGPDFLNARVQIDKMMWNGHVEIHVDAADWATHGHMNDKAYDNVILHVVWENNRPAHRHDGSEIPTIALKNKIDAALFDNFLALQAGQQTILCAPQLGHVTPITIHNMLDRALSGRLQRKAETITNMLNACQGDWEETTYRILARNFGFKLNADAFELLSNSLPLRTLMRHRHHPLQLHAMLYGQAGLLPAEPDDYAASLVAEYLFLQKKYDLEPRLSRHHWKFLRLRPANFPTIRLAQFTALLLKQPSLFSQIVTGEGVPALRQHFAVELPEYWQRHYDFGKQGHVAGRLGKGSIDNILINTVAPLLAAYTLETGDQQHLERALEILQSLKNEDNNIIRKWCAAGVGIATAFDSQAALELYHSYCTHKKCLDCQIGVSLVQNVPGHV